MNRVMLTGRLTKDPELRRTTNGNNMVRFTLAVNRSFRTPGQPEADFLFCVAFGKTAENVARYLHKGSLIGVDGSIQTGSYVNQQGVKVYTTDILCDRVEFLESRRASQEYGADNGYNNNGYNNGYQSNQGYSNPGYNNQNQGYSNSGYNNNQNYGGGYQDSYQSGYNSTSNPYAQSVDNGFGTPASAPKPETPSYSAPASSNTNDEDTSSLFDDSQTLDISSDDLPF